MEKRTIVDLIKPHQNGIIEVQYADLTIYEGEVLKRVTRMKVLPPADDISGEHETVQAICNALWTPEIIKAYKDAE
jgi:hypothetical protein